MSAAIPAVEEPPVREKEPPEMPTRIGSLDEAKTPDSPSESGETLVQEPKLKNKW